MFFSKKIPFFFELFHFFFLKNRGFVIRIKRNDIVSHLVRGSEEFDGIVDFGTDSGMVKTPKGLAYHKGLNVIFVADEGYGTLKMIDTIPVCFGRAADEHFVCSRNGKCVSNDICSCNPGVSGDKCDFFYCWNIANNDTNVCSGHGACANPNNCKCDFGYNGDNCQYSKPLYLKTLTTVQDQRLKYSFFLNNFFLRL